MSSRARRGVALGVVLALCAAGSVTALVWGKSKSDADALPVPTGTTSIPAGDVLAYRLLDGNSGGTFGTLGVATVGDPPGPPTSTGLPCDRVHVAAGRGICLRRTTAPRYAVRLLDAQLRVTGEITLIGLPSRTRVSNDGRFGSVTAFSRGHNYTRPGQFSTTTTLIDMDAGKAIGDLEKFTVTKSGKTFRSVDFNFWGVSFFPDDSNRFVATLATRGTTYLVRGDVAGRRMEVIHENAECPSLSPDGTRVAYKKRVGGPGVWRFHVLDLATGAEQALAETRSIDDQLEWRDNDSVMFGFAEDIWIMSADGEGQPRVLVDGGDSPALWRRGS